MILYLDAVAFIKLYVAEPGSGTVRRAVLNATAAYTVDGTYLEVRSALARAAQLGLLREQAARQARADFENDWRTVNAIVPDPSLLRQAAEIAEAHAVTPGVALHAATLHRLRDHSAGLKVRFAAGAGVSRLATQLGFEPIEER